ncbi:lipoprotein-releasing ABC transporter ATP-binding protein LolD [Shewanella sp. A3A]|uniref:Lipoprotein-releasing system ATP-binding protein LolD n=1 Tax=Shewanella electrica TaxID=515560 RepID=A0ABT2FKD1_9GAMM|nr:lipoprotein-releasing ABC transporter ATP-binding protein LolD [Shewanella electrica]MCH1920953.1 lipoprotein-releasing ABC transporter ATP-binding protein LolD [Shewanella ferrihydritica]MCH1924769.1 lipoprotein-releasing ABC transporter ATP-binding protein LolD [Shewanella electrica]MCS4556784.1 lipoprotein-releasing ABC transporter ATP-binding protein LolD [Shewanella electrica]
MEKPPLLQVIGVSKSYQEGKVSTPVLHEVSLTVNAGEQLAIVGSSGSGKSTLLHIMGTLDKPTAGKVLLDGEDLYRLSVTKQAKMRNEQLGFIYQFHHLLPEFSALENVSMPGWIAGENKKRVAERAAELLDRVGLSHRLKHLPSELSGGERQRVAIARALINQPRLVLADEPTGNLDATSGEAVYQLVQELAKQYNTAFVVVTHDQTLAARMDRQLHMVDGHLQPVGALEQN